VTLTFEEAVTLPANPIEVTGPDGSSWTVGSATINGASVSAPVETTGPAGQYTLRYTVTADDGDAVKGTVRFTLTSAVTPTTTEAAAPTTAAEAAAPVTAAPAPAARGTESSGTSMWVWVAVAVVVVGVLAAVGLVRARRRATGAPPHNGLARRDGVWLSVALLFISATGLTWSSHAGAASRPRSLPSRAPRRSSRPNPSLSARLRLSPCRQRSTPPMQWVSPGC